MFIIHSYFVYFNYYTLLSIAYSNQIVEHIHIVMAGSTLVSTLILLVAIVYPFISLIREVPISPSFNMEDTTSTEYNIQDIKAPKVSGPLVHALAYIVAKSPLSPFVLVSPRTYPCSIQVNRKILFLTTFFLLHSVNYWMTMIFT